MKQNEQRTVKGAEIRFIKATGEDIIEVTKLCSLLYVDDNTKTENVIKEKVEEAIKGNLLWVAKMGNVIVGFQLVELFGEGHKNFPNSVFLFGLYVVESYRRSGIGRQLVWLVLKENYPIQYKYFSVTYDSSKPALGEFYGVFGFKQDGLTKAGNVRMIKQRIE